MHSHVHAESPGNALRESCCRKGTPPILQRLARGARPGAPGNCEQRSWPPWLPTKQKIPRREPNSRCNGPPATQKEFEIRRKSRRRRKAKPRVATEKAEVRLLAPVPRSKGFPG